MHSVLEQRKHWQKQYISIGRTVVWGCAETLPWFPPGNLSCHHPRACRFYHLVVFLGSCLLWCSVPRCLLRLIGSLRAWLRRQDSLPPVPRSSYDSLSLFEWYFCFFVAFCSRPEDVHEADELDEIVPTSALMIVLFTLVSCPGMLNSP